MELTILEGAVLFNALRQYIPYCEDCLGNPENEEQFTFIKGELEIARRLIDKLNADYLSRGGLADRL